MPSCLYSEIANNQKEEKIEFLDCSKYRILLVDDNLLNIKVAEKLLSQYKFNIDHCLSGLTQGTNDCKTYLKSIGKKPAKPVSADNNE